MFSSCGRGILHLINHLSHIKWASFTTLFFRWEEFRQCLEAKYHLSLQAACSSVPSHLCKRVKVKFLISNAFIFLVFKEALFLVFKENWWLCTKIFSLIFLEGWSCLCTILFLLPLNWQMPSLVWSVTGTQSPCIVGLCFSRVQLYMTAWTVACQAVLCVKFSMQEY